MRPRFSRIPRWAWLVSLALHALAAGGLYLLLPNVPTRGVPVASSEAPADPTTFSLSMADDTPPPSDTIPLTIPTPPQPTPQPPVAPPPPESERLPLKNPEPPVAVAEPVIDIPVPPAVSDVKPAEFVAPPAVPQDQKTPPGGRGSQDLAAKGKPIHGQLPADSVAVYVLDRSASMGLNRDTFDAARAALIATVAATKDGAKFQVLAYHTKTEPVLPASRGKLIAAEERTLRDVADAVAELKAEGRSDHAAALKAALALGADYVLWITDATDDELAKAKRALKGASKPVAVYVVRAANGAVAEPAELR